MRQANFTTFAVRAAQTTDISNGLCDLLLLADPDPQTVTSYVSSGHCYAVVVDGRLSGAAVLSETAPDTLEIKSIAVAPELQGRGIGKLVLAFLIQEARTREYARLTVFTGNSSLGPLALYQKAGFRMVGITPDYFIEHYAERIEEHGIHCRDRIQLHLDLRK